MKWFHSLSIIFSMRMSPEELVGGAMTLKAKRSPFCLLENYPGHEIKLQYSASCRINMNAETPTCSRKP